MSGIIARQPNGLICRFSQVVDDITDYNLTEEEYIELCAEQAREEAKRTLKERIKPFDQIIKAMESSMELGYNGMSNEDWENLIRSMSDRNAKCRYFSVAIDGPAGAGKTTVAKRLAKELGFTYVDTGAMYRAFGLYLIINGITIDEENKIKEVCRTIDISLGHNNGEQTVYLNGEDVSGKIRTPEIGMMASNCGTNSDIRAKLVELQRKIADSSDVVMEGRDICSYVLPNADVKIYLTAESRIRANRRYLELMETNQECDLRKLEDAIITRDRQDMERAISPLKYTPGSHLVDSSYKSINATVDMIIGLVKEKRYDK